MGTTADKLQRALDNKNAIKQAIINKGGTVGDNMSEYASAIDNLPSGGGENLLQTLITGKGAYAGKNLFYNYKGNNVDFIKDLDFSNNGTADYMFAYAENLISIPTNFMTNNVESLDSTFNSCFNLKSISLSNTDNVKRWNYTFSDCREIQTIILSNTSNTTSISGICNMCRKLKYISPLNTDKCTSITESFRNCTNLEIIDFSSWDLLSGVHATNNTFTDCSSLKKLIIRKMTIIPPLNTNSFTTCYHFTGTVHSTYNPEGLKDGRIYVPDNMVDSLKQATNWSAYADIIVPLSTLEE